MKDQKHCQPSSAFLAYAFGKEIRFLHLDGFLHKPPYQTIESDSPTVGLDFDYEEQLVFFTVLSKSIVKVHFNGTGMKVMKINSKFYYGIEGGYAVTLNELPLSPLRSVQASLHPLFLLGCKAQQKCNYNSWGAPPPSSNPSHHCCFELTNFIHSRVKLAVFLFVHSYGRWYLCGLDVKTRLFV
jgi:hypothetical protein